MGAYSQAPALTTKLLRQVERDILVPILHALRNDEVDYRGVIFAGLMLTKGGPRVIEFNVRFGDPETQVLVPRLASDLLPALIAAADGALAGHTLEWRDEAALCVVMATRGYPGAYDKGSVIGGLAAAGAMDGVTVFHAGTKLADGQITASGGRVLGVTARAPTIAGAQVRAYAAVDAIDWPEGFCRRDIGWRALGG